MGKILITDDDQTCRDSIQKVFERNGHTVSVAGDVDGALKELSAAHFDLIVCDYRMPGKTGIDLLRELRNRRLAVPVLMISAYADSHAEVAVRELGALKLLWKPIRKRELLDSTSKVLGG